MNQYVRRTQLLDSLRRTLRNLQDVGRAIGKAGGAKKLADKEKKALVARWENNWTLVTSDLSELRCTLRNIEDQQRNACK